MAHRIYIISDTHLGHEMLTTNGYRPKGFSDKILNNTRRLYLDDQDTIYHLGDVALGDKEEYHNTLFTVSSCAGHCVLIRGNHDKRSTGWYLSHGWDAVLNMACLNVYGHRVLLSHEPVETDGNMFTVNIHGHLHDNQHRTDEYPFLNERNILYACETYHYQPVQLKTLLGV